MRSHFPRSAAGYSLFILTALFVRPANCQALDRAHPKPPVVNPANAWQEEVREPKSAPASQEGLAIRAARDAYVDKVYGVGMPIEQLESSHLSYSFPNSELSRGSSGIHPAFRNEFVVAGKFDAFDCVLSKSHQAIYEEVHIRVDRIIYPGTLLAGSTIDILIPGGAVSLHGRSVFYHTAPEEYGISPGGRYVLFLRHMQPGDFFLLVESISLEGGTAHPNTQAAARAAADGKWPFAGLPEAALFARLTTELNSQRDVSQ